MSPRGKRLNKLLSPVEFQMLGDGLAEAARLQSEVARGTKVEFDAIFQKILPIARKDTGWPELKAFTADMAENAGEMESAIQLYNASKEDASPELAARVDARIARLSSSLSGTMKTEASFDVATTKAGSTAYSSVYYETSLGADGPRIAQAILGKFDNDFANLSDIFDGIKLPKPFDIVIKRIDPNGEGRGGAYHYGCSDQTLYVDAKTKPAVDAELSSFLAVSQAADVFGAVQNKGWTCGNSNGSALKRVLAVSLYPDKGKDWDTASIWLDTPDRPDWVSKSAPTDIDAVAVGCAVLFLNYLHSQLDIPWAKIVQAGGSNLSETYANLGLGSDGFAKFRQLLGKHFPAGKPSRLTTDNPFPL